MHQSKLVKAERYYTRSLPYLVTVVIRYFFVLEGHMRIIILLLGDDTPAGADLFTPAEDPEDEWFYREMERRAQPAPVDDTNIDSWYPAYLDMLTWELGEGK